MKNFWSRLAVELGRRAGPVAAVGLILTGVFGYGLTQLDFATDQDSYLNKSDQVYKDSVAYQDLFGGQAMLSVLRTEPGTDVVDLMSADNQAVFADISQEIGGAQATDGQGVPNVFAVVTPLTALQLSDTLIQKTPDGEQADGPDPDHRRRSAGQRRRPRARRRRGAQGGPRHPGGRGPHRGLARDPPAPGRHPRGRAHPRTTRSG